MLHARLEVEHREQMAALVDDRQTAVTQGFHRFRIGKAVEADAPQDHPAWRELHQLRVLPGDGEQGAGQRVPGQAGGFVLLEAGQGGFQHQAVVRQPDAGGAGLLVHRLLLPEQAQLVVPVQALADGQQGEEAQQQDGRQQAVEARRALGVGGHGVTHSVESDATACQSLLKAS
ncbi:hypothetical protein D3C78_1124810 [compost metagenome]